MPNGNDSVNLVEAPEKVSSRLNLSVMRAGERASTDVYANKLRRGRENGGMPKPSETVEFSDKLEWKDEHGPLDTAFSIKPPSSPSSQTLRRSPWQHKRRRPERRRRRRSAVGVRTKALWELSLVCRHQPVHVSARGHEGDKDVPRGDDAHSPAEQRDRICSSQSPASIITAKNPPLKR